MNQKREVDTNTAQLFVCAASEMGKSAQRQSCGIFIVDIAKATEGATKVDSVSSVRSFLRSLLHYRIIVNRASES